MRVICHILRDPKPWIATAISVALLVPMVAAAGIQAERELLSGTVSSPLRWMHVRTVVNPLGGGAPVNSTIAAAPGRLTWSGSTAPMTTFTANYPVPPGALAPGRAYSFPVTVSGRVTGGSDTPGFRRIDVILYVGDRWVDSTVGPKAAVVQECGSPSYGAPVACSAPASVRGRLGLVAPTPAGEGSTFSFGVGALNCSSCYVRFEYRATSEPATPSTPAVVPIDSVANGCGGAGWRPFVEAQNVLGNTSTYWNSDLLYDPTAHSKHESYTVDFTEACKLHDAGYAGAVVGDALRGGVKDFRGWSRKQVDDKLLADMRLLCTRRIPAKAAIALRNCRAGGGNFSVGAGSRYHFVRCWGNLFFDADLRVRGTQRTGPRSNDKISITSRHCRFAD